MADDRTRDQKLMARALHDGDPTERDNARRMLRARGLWPPPPSLDDAGPIAGRDHTAEVATMPGSSGGVHYHRSSIGGRRSA